MLASSLINGILKRGGTAELIDSPHSPGRQEVIGTLNGHDVHAYVRPHWETGKPDCGGYFTVRSIAKRGHHDPYADYNSGGHTFCDRIRDLDWAAR